MLNMANVQFNIFYTVFFLKAHISTNIHRKYSMGTSIDHQDNKHGPGMRSVMMIYHSSLYDLRRFKVELAILAVNRLRS